MNHPAFRIATLALTTAAALACAITLPVDVHAQRRSAQGATGGTPNAPVRRGAPGATPQPLTTISIALGGALYDALVDADCHIDQRATPGSTRAYFIVMYPWFGQRPLADQPTMAPQPRYPARCARGLLRSVHLLVRGCFQVRDNPDRRWQRPHGLGGSSGDTTQRRGTL